MPSAAAESILYINRRSKQEAEKEDTSHTTWLEITEITIHISAIIIRIRKLVFCPEQKK